MVKHPTNRHRLSQRVRKLARLTAAAVEPSLSNYVAHLVVRDARRTGIDELVTTDAAEVTP